MKKTGIIILVIFLILVVLLLTKNIIAKNTVSGLVRGMTGLGLSMKNLEVGVFKSRVSIEGLELFNPAGFEEELMLDMPKIFVDYNLGSFLKGKIHLRDLNICLKEFIVVKNAGGQINLDSLKALQPKGTGKMPQLQIDSMELVIGKVIFKDYSRGTRPRISEFNVNINERYKNINDPHKLVSLIVVKSLMHTTIAKLANFDIRPLTDVLGDTLKTATKLAAKTVGTIVKVGADLGAEAKDITKETVGATGNVIKDILRLGD